MSTSRKPDFRIKATTRPNVTPKLDGVIGAGWQNEDGSISLKLDPFVTIAGRDDLIITAFPIDRPENVMGLGGGIVPLGYIERKRHEAKEKGLIIPICPDCGMDAPFLAGGYITQCGCGYNALDPFADFPFNGSYDYGGPDCSGPGDQSSEK